MTSATDLLLSRRSVPPLLLKEPGPSAEQVTTLLTAASRVPDHGKLAPWRFILVEGEHRAAFADALEQAALREAGADPQRLADEKRRYEAPLLIVVVSCAGPHEKIPEWEQVLSAGAVCMNLLMAAHAQGFAGSWITGRPAYEDGARPVLGLADGEKVAGFVFIGTPDVTPTDRPRPDLEQIVTRWRPA
jgi:nitroreductase